MKRWMSKLRILSLSVAIVTASLGGLGMAGTSNLRQ